MERERAAHSGGEEMFAGVRTFPIFALLGASLTVVTGGMTRAGIAGFLALAAPAGVSYWRASGGGGGGPPTPSAAPAPHRGGATAGGGALGVAAGHRVT